MGIGESIERVAKFVFWVGVAVITAWYVFHLVGCGEVQGRPTLTELERTEQQRHHEARCRELQVDLGVEWLRMACSDETIANPGRDPRELYACGALEEYERQCPTDE